MALSEEQLQALAVKAKYLGEIKQHPVWGELRQLLEQRKAKHFDSLAKQLAAGEAVDQRWIDRMAGFFRGAEWILDNPDMAEESLERAFHKAAPWRREEHASGSRRRAGRV